MIVVELRGNENKIERITAFCHLTQRMTVIHYRVRDENDMIYKLPLVCIIITRKRTSVYIFNMCHEKNRYK